MKTYIDKVKIEYIVIPDGVIVDHIVVPEADRSKGLAKKVIFKLMKQVDRPRAFFCPTSESIQRITGQPPAVRLPEGRIMFVIGEAPENPYPPITLYHDDRDGELYMKFVGEGRENALAHYIRHRSRFWDYYEYQAKLIEAS